MLSDAEEAEMDRARASGFRGDHDGNSDDGHGHTGHYHVEDEEERVDNPVNSIGGSSGYDSHAQLLKRRGSDEDSGMQAHPVDQRHPGPHQAPTRNTFDFGAREDWATKEKDAGPGDRPAAWIPNGKDELRGNPANGANESYDTAIGRTNTLSAFEDDHETAFSPKESELGASQPGFHRRRQRKLSQSNPVHRRQGKLALFEGFGTQGAAAEGEAGEIGAPPLKAARQPKNLGPSSNGFSGYSDAAPGHDRPYRFSFYSNALPVTIHARSLAELPAEGQSFEDLFKGRNQGADETQRTNGEGTDYGSIRTAPRGSDAMPSGGLDPTAMGGKLSMLARAAGTASKQNPNGGGPPDVTADEDPEAFTWWLDVLSPSDEEMRMLSKVSSRCESTADGRSSGSIR